MSRIGPVHKDPHPLRNRAVSIQGQPGIFGVMDWFDRETGQTWDSLRDYNRLATTYVGRRRMKRLPKDDEVVVVYTMMGGTLAVHDSELEEIDDGTQEAE